MSICSTFSGLSIVALSCFVVSLSSCVDNTRNNSSKRFDTDLIDIPGTAATVIDSKESNELKGPVIKMDELEFKFGTIVAGRHIKHYFSFINAGDSPLIISNIKAPCGCTVAKDWPRQPILPGEKGEILVVFDSSDRVGPQVKTIDVVTNTRPANLTLKLIGDVIGPDHLPSDIKH
ncbi:MAG: hypothetical protein COA49_01590 [Bacteroidetes bacterium]|nr:MAG: hypothetical protein COA49_01590 [Bacteroidota bacterium]